MCSDSVAGPRWPARRSASRASYFGEGLQRHHRERVAEIVWRDARSAAAESLRCQVDRSLTRCLKCCMPRSQADRQAASTEEKAERLKAMFMLNDCDPPEMGWQ